IAVHQQVQHGRGDVIAAAPEKLGRPFELVTQRLMGGRRSAPYRNKETAADQYLRFAEARAQRVDLDRDRNDEDELLVLDDLGPAMRADDFLDEPAGEPQLLT